MGQNKLRFNGYDWSELDVVLGLDYKSFKDERKAFRAFQKALMKAAQSSHGCGDSQTAAKVRQFLLALEKIGGYFKPFYKGLRSIEHDGIMLRLVAENLGDLWT